MATVSLVQQSTKRWMVARDGTVVGTILKSKAGFEAQRNDKTALGTFGDRYEAMRVFTTEASTVEFATDDKAMAKEVADERARLRRLVRNCLEVATDNTANETARLRQIASWCRKEMERTREE